MLQKKFRSGVFVHGLAPLQEAPEHRVSAYCEQAAAVARPYVLHTVHGWHTPSLVSPLFHRV